MHRYQWSQTNVVLFEYIKTWVGDEELQKATMHFGIPFCKEETCHKDLYISWQAFPTSYYYCFLWKKIQCTTFFSVPFFYFKEKKSLKCDNMIIKRGCFCLSSIVPVFVPLTVKISNLRNMHTTIHPTTYEWW